MNEGSTTEGQLYLRSAQLRARWGGMPVSTFYWRRAHGLIPEPVFLFGGTTPYWAVSVIEEFERQAAAKATP